MNRHERRKQIAVRRAETARTERQRANDAVRARYGFGAVERFYRQFSLRGAKISWHRDSGIPIDTGAADDTVLIPPKSRFQITGEMRNVRTGTIIADDDDTGADREKGSNIG